MKAKKTDKELADYVIDHIQKDLEINKQLHGIDFSDFLSEYVNLFTGCLMYQRNREKHDKAAESLRYVAAFKLRKAEKAVEECYGKKPRFFNSSKAGFAMTYMHDFDEFSRVTTFADRLYKESSKDSPKQLEMNICASETLYRI
ncbi:hypothetical protein JXB28_01750 [Candidatus Woesearchaeota archaeon]|nr:hypothetical protein [Candidatus Woesearchaeota archaeon]